MPYPLGHGGSCSSVHSASYWRDGNIELKPGFLVCCRVWEMPFDGPPGVAMPPADDGSMPGVFFVNVRRPQKV